MKAIDTVCVGARAALTADSSSDDALSSSHHEEPAPAQVHQNIHVAGRSTSNDQDSGFISFLASTLVGPSTSVEMLTAPEPYPGAQTILSAAPVTLEPVSVWVSNLLKLSDRLSTPYVAHIARLSYQSLLISFWDLAKVCMRNALWSL